MSSNSKKNNRIRKLLNLLSDGHFHSGESLGQSLGITRSAIWKNIQNLQQRGVIIRSINGKGYQIPNGLCLLDENKIAHHLSVSTQSILSELICFDKVKSTNDYLLTQVNFQNPQVRACFAEQQTDGKGRRGRTWVSPYANNIYHSLLYYFDKDVSELTGLSLAVAVIISRAIQQFGITNGLELKWPNDILWHSKKLCGVLVEMLTESHQCCAAVIGVGINTRLTTQQILNRPITSIESILNKPTNRNQLAAILLNKLINGLEEFKLNGLNSFMSEWQNLDSFTGKMVRLITPQQEIIGLMKGVSACGELLLENTQGCVNAYLSGEVSLQKLEE